ncbi:MAG: dihydroorotate dehydrogenase 2 [Actinomycetota bacterium]
MGLYRTLVRPAVFSLPPESGHRVVETLLRMPLPWRAIGGVPRDPRLQVDLGGVVVANPVGLAAGFDKQARMLPHLADLGFGFAVAGTFTRRTRAGNPSPRIVRHPVDEALVNAMGLPNPGAAVAAARLARLQRNGPRFASIADESVEDALEVHRLLAPQVDAFELNASCPNVAWGRDRDTEEHLRALVAALVERSDEPLFVKLPPVRTQTELDAVRALASIARDAGAAGLTCGNTRPVEEPALSVGRGGLSGWPLLAGTLGAVAAVRAEVGPQAVVQGCGGITTASDLRACLDAGANAVQVYSALIYRGPRIVRDLCRGLLETTPAASAPMPPS